MKKTLLVTVSLISLCHAADHISVPAGVLGQPSIDVIDPTKRFDQLTQAVTNAPALEKIHHLKAIQQYLLWNIHDPKCSEYIGILRQYAETLIPLIHNRIMQDPSHKDAFTLYADRFAFRCGCSDHVSEEDKETAKEGLRSIIRAGHQNAVKAAALLFSLKGNDKDQELSCLFLRDIVIRHQEHEDFIIAAKGLFYDGGWEDRKIARPLLHRLASSIVGMNAFHAAILLLNSENADDGDKAVAVRSLEQIALTPGHDNAFNAAEALPKSKTDSCFTEAYGETAIRSFRALGFSEHKDAFEALRELYRLSTGDEEKKLQVEILKIAQSIDHKDAFEAAQSLKYERFMFKPTSHDELKELARAALIAIGLTPNHKDADKVPNALISMENRAKINREICLQMALLQNNEAGYDAARQLINSLNAMSEYKPESSRPYDSDDDELDDRDPDVKAFKAIAASPDFKPAIYADLNYFYRLSDLAGKKNVLNAARASVAALYHPHFFESVSFLIQSGTPEDQALIRTYFGHAIEHDLLRAGYRGGYLRVMLRSADPLNQAFASDMITRYGMRARSGMACH